mmetsp:Transcript_57536/g.101953  ORF Transcript_57536/g.101953 Transcript_57536/m.101953 type:complete len:372 (-) Transcript_57536:7-1122(-)
MQCRLVFWSLSRVLFVLSFALAVPCAECDHGREETSSLNAAHAQRSSLLLGGRRHATHEIRAADAAVEISSGAPDKIKGIVRSGKDAAWQTAGLATSARAAVANLRAKAASTGAEISAKAASENSWVSAPMPNQIKDAEEQAQRSLDEALAYEAAVKNVVAEVEQKAYKAARLSADEEVAKLEKEAGKYYDTLEAKFKALATSDKKTAADAAAQAAQPYVDVQLGVSSAVLTYNTKAIEMINQANGLIKQAFTLANVAKYEQATGDPVMAQRHMMQAHGMIGTAKQLKQDAYKVRKLAESLNMSIPSYQKAAQMASIHALATFSGVQLDVHSQATDVQRQAQDTSQQAARALSDLTIQLERASRELTLPGL